MPKKKVHTYAPHERDFFDIEPREIRSYSETKDDYTILPDPVTDPIVSNNISYVEFDYTYNGGQEFPDIED
ncbi:hypothetical protein [Clostridium sp.]|uniref:hypothetical protein n=1 Tax=Clostridium sp. TaxID=1506 RepID=UPI003D6D9068